MGWAFYPMKLWRALGSAPMFPAHKADTGRILSLTEPVGTLGFSLRGGAQWVLWGGRDPSSADESLGSEKLTCWGWEETWSRDP